MFCRFGLRFDATRPGRGHGLRIGGVDAAVLMGGLEQAVHGLAQLDRVAVGHQGDQERVSGLDQQVGQRLGIGGETGLDLLGARQMQLFEQDHLQLLGTGEIDLMADRGERVVGCLVHLFG